MGVGAPDVGEGCCRMDMGEEGGPQGVSMLRDAT